MQSNRYLIVVGLDYSELGDEAFRRAYQLASLQPAAELHAISVTPPAAVAPLTGYNSTDSTTPLRLDELDARLTQHVAALLAKLEGSYRADVVVVSHTRIDAPLVGITQLASELNADLIVVGTHGRQGIARWLLGSVAEGVVRHAACPVMIIPPLSPIADLPKIEPACAICLEVRRLSGGRELWCAQHSERLGQRHTYHQRDRTSEDASLPLVTR